MLMERRIVVTSRRLSKLTACIHGAEALMRPLHWLVCVVIGCLYSQCCVFDVPHVLVSSVDINCLYSWCPVHWLVLLILTACIHGAPYIG